MESRIKEKGQYIKIKRDLAILYYDQDQGDHEKSVKHSHEPKELSSRLLKALEHKNISFMY